MMDAALANVAEGFAVFPVKLDKTPHTKHGLKDATRMQAEVREYWTKWPDAGIGLVTDGLVVLDFDAKNGGRESLTALKEKYGPFTKTRTHRTGGGGLHYLYSGQCRNTVNLGGFKGVDLRGNGGYIVVPPSPHVSGKSYQVLDDSPIAEAPEWLMALAQTKQPLEATDGPISEGERNSKLASWAGIMRRMGMPESSILAALIDMNDTQCSPPLLEEEVKAIAQSIARYAPQPAQQQSPGKAPQDDIAAETKANEVHVPGFVLRDSTVGEMVIDDPTGERAFALRSPSGAVSKVREYTSGGVTYKPMTDGLAGHTVLFASMPTDYGDLASLLAEVRRFVHRYVELPASFEAISALYVLLTWVHDFLLTLAYLRALGDYGTGKTRFLEVIGSVVFRAIRAAGATTPSPIFRIIDIYGGTLVLDEADFSKSDAMAEVVKILNSGYKPGSPVLRSEPTASKKWEPRSYDVFGPKILATRTRWTDRALESRCLTWETEGLSREDIPLVLGPRFQADAAALRSKLLAFRLDYLPKVKGLNLEDARPVGNLEPRLQEILLPLKALAQGDEALEATLDEFVMGIQEELQEDRRNSLSALVLESILAIREQDGEPSAKAIADRLNDEGLVREHLDRPEQGITPRRVGAIVKGLGLKTRPATGSRRAVVQWNDRRMAILCRRHGLPIPPNNPSHPSVEPDILHQHPSPQRNNPSPLSPVAGVRNARSEGSEGSCPGTVKAERTAPVGEAKEVDDDEPHF